MSDAQEKTKPKDEVIVRILPKGHDLVFTGELCAKTNRPTTHQKGDLVTLPRIVAESLEARGFAEIEIE